MATRRAAVQWKSPFGPSSPSRIVNFGPLATHGAETGSDGSPNSFSGLTVQETKAE